MMKARLSLPVLLLLGAVVCAGWVHGGGSLCAGTAGQMAFCTLQTGGGGFMTAMKFANDGTAVTKSDVFGDWVKTPSGTSWSQLITTSAWPTSTGFSDGPYDIAIAPTDSQRLYVIQGGKLYFSTNQGATWTAYTNWTTLSGSASGNGQGMPFQDRRSGPRMAVDPNNANVLYITTPENGVFVTTSANSSSATFTAITSIPPAISAAGGGNGGTQLTTNSSTASGNNVLHFASGAGSVSGTIIDITNPAAIPAGTTVSSSTSTSITMSANAAATVNSSDVINIGGVFYGYTIAVDPGSGCPTSCTGGISNNVYVAPYGSQVYKSTNAGSTWAATSSGPTSFTQMIVAGGVVYVVDESTGAGTSNGSIWKYASSTWSQPNVLSGVHGIAADPANSARLIYITEGGSIALSTDSATTWGTVTAGGRVCSDIPWQALTNEGFMTSGYIAFDPSQSNVLYFAEGIGVWTASFTGAAFNWTCKSKGIENLVTNQIISSPSYTWPVIGVWDRQMFHFTDPTTYTATQQPAYGLNNSIVHGWSLDYASSAPGTICALVDTGNPFGASYEYSGCSTDGGVTWTQFANSPVDPIIATTAATTAGNATLTFTSVPQSLLTSQYASILDLGFLLPLSAQANPGDTVLHFASVPATLPNGANVVIFSGVGSFNGLLSVASSTSTTVTLSGGSVGTTIPAGAIIRLASTGTPISGSATISSMTSTTVVLSANVVSPGVLSGETIMFQGQSGGGIAVSTPSNIVIQQSDNWKYQNYTKDGGTTWKNAVICATYAGTNPQTCSVNATGFDSNGAAIADGNGQYGWGGTYFNNIKQIAADRVTANKFYALNFRASGSGGGIYVTTDGGDTWTRANTSTCGATGPGFASKIETVPSNAGHFFCSWSNWQFGNTGLYRSCDGGTTVSQMSLISNVRHFAVGATKPGNSYPSVYFMGQYNGVSGIWRSDNMSAGCTGTETFQRVWSDYYPGGWMNDISWLDADKSVWARIYVGRGQTGAVFGLQN